jgi:hypothetical protein
MYPINIHLPTETLLKTLVDNNIPLTEPNGASSKESPRLPSVKPSLALIPGIAATHIPNKRLEVENKNPTENTDLFFMKEVKFLTIVFKKEDANLR